MEQPKKAPQRYCDLKDPKLPEIRSMAVSEGTMRRPSPLPTMPKEL